MSAAGRLPPSSSSATTDVLAESWSTVAGAYERVLVPRFAPWTNDALDRLRGAYEGTTPSNGNESKALVLCCGPGQELLPVAKITRGRVLGIDLAPGMIDAARRRIKEECAEECNARYEGSISAAVGDATEPPPGPYEVVFSAFGLQQLPKPVDAVKEWMGRLRPGGICAFVYWPPDPPKADGGDDGPFELWSNLVRKKLGKDANAAVVEAPPWDEGLRDGIVASGGDVLEDEYVSHEMRWNDGDDLFEGMSRAGPWHTLRLRRGDAFVDELGGELRLLHPPGAPLRFETSARVIVARRR